MNKKQLVFSNITITAILSSAIFAMLLSISLVPQVSAQNATESTASDKGTPFAVQQTVESVPDTLAPGHEQYHQIAVILPERHDGKIFVGTITFSATQPLQVVVQHPFAEENILNTTSTGVPLGGSAGENVVTLLHHEEGQFFDNDMFAGSGLYLHSRASEPFVVSYTVAGMLVDQVPFPQ